MIETSVKWVARRFILNRCLHWEKNGKGRYIGFLNPLFDIDAFFFPWVRNDGDKGFVEWLILRFGWYPVPPTCGSEVSAYDRKALRELIKEGGDKDGN